jgi:hypothetical protein
VSAYSPFTPWHRPRTKIDHRYDLIGFVLDENERPIVGSPVSIHLGNNEIGYQQTSSEGYYKIKLHLHDPDWGKQLLVHTGGVEPTLRVSFTPGDKSTKRVHHANFVGGRLVEHEFARLRYSPWIYGGGAALLAKAAVVIIGRRRARQTAQARKKSKR